MLSRIRSYTEPQRSLNLTEIMEGFKFRPDTICFCLDGERFTSADEVETDHNKDLYAIYALAG
jgi:hypothetical protein